MEDIFSLIIGFLWKFYTPDPDPEQSLSGVPIISGASLALVQFQFISSQNSPICIHPGHQEGESKSQDVVVTEINSF